MEQYKKDFIEFMVDCQVLKADERRHSLLTPAFTVQASS